MVPRNLWIRLQNRAWQKRLELIYSATMYPWTFYSLQWLQPRKYAAYFMNLVFPYSSKFIYKLYLMQDKNFFLMSEQIEMIITRNYMNNFLHELVKQISG